MHILFLAESKRIGGQWNEDFKEYYNIKYVSIQLYEWDSKGQDQSNIMYNFTDD